MAENFKLYSKYYDLLYQDKFYNLESEYVVKELWDYKPKLKNILELGCGSGAHAKYLCQRGFSLTGIDRSEQMISEAKKKNIPGFHPQVGDITDFSLDKRFDAVISLFHVMSYLSDNQKLFSCLQLVNKHLHPDGIFLFDCWFTPAVYSIKPENRSKHFENSEIRVVRKAESTLNISKNSVSVNFDIQITDKRNLETEVLKETHEMRHFSIPEMEFFAQQSGFKLIKVEEFVTQAKAGLESWAVCFMIQKVREL